MRVRLLVRASQNSAHRAKHGFTRAISNSIPFCRLPVIKYQITNFAPCFSLYSGRKQGANFQFCDAVSHSLGWHLSPVTGRFTASQRAGAVCVKYAPIKAEQGGYSLCHIYRWNALALGDSRYICTVNSEYLCHLIFCVAVFFQP